MTDELCEKDIRQAFESGRLMFERTDGGFRATIEEYTWGRPTEPIVRVEFIVREERGPSYGPSVPPAFAVEIKGRCGFQQQNTTKVYIPQALYEAIRYKVQEAELQDEIRFKKDVKALLNRDV